MLHRSGPHRFQSSLLSIALIVAALAIPASATNAQIAAPTAVETAPLAATDSATFVPLTPARLLDSRFGNGLSGKFSANTPRTFQVSGRGGVPSNATAVTGNLTVTGQSAAGAAFLGPEPIATPTTSTLNFPLGDNRANGVTVALGAGGGLSITYMASSGATADFVFDVSGYFTPDSSGASFVALPPARLLDSRFGNGLSGKFSANTPRTFQVSGRGGVPAAATAVTGNLTVTGQSVSGYAFLGPDPMPAPSSSTLNFPLGDNRANGVTVALGAGGTLSITYGASSGATADFVFDVTGYFVPDQTGATYLALNPARLLDTRFANGLAGKFSANTPRTFQVSDRGGVPANATAVTGNLTVTGQNAAGYAFLGPDPLANPTSSTLNFPLGDNRANGVTVALGAGGTLSITYGASSGATADFVFDVTGYFVLDPSLAPPAVVGLYPQANASGVSDVATLSVRFSEAVTGVSDASFVLRDKWTGAAVPALVGYDAANFQANLDPSATLLAGHAYTATLDSSIQDEAGNALPLTSWTFITTPLVVSQTYQFQSTVDYDASTLTTLETLSWTNQTASNLSTLPLSVIPTAASAFTLTGAVYVNGVAATTTLSGQTLTVNFSQTLAPTETAIITIPFKLTVAANGGAFGARLSRWNGIMQFGEWFPVYSYPHNFYSIGEPQVTYNADWMSLDLTSTRDLGVNAVAATGDPQSLAASHWVWKATNVRDFAFSVYPGYVLNTGTVAGTTVRAYTRLASGTSWISWATGAMTKYAAWYGPYGAASLTLAEVGSSNFSMEFPQLVFVGANMSNSSTLYHETAHMWWYHLLGNDQIAEPWLDEAWASFSARIALGIAFSSCSTLNVDSAITAFTAWSGNCSAYTETVYQKGGYFINQLRLRMGDTAFFAALRGLFNQYRYGVITTVQLHDALENYNSTNITDLFAQYTGRY